MRSAARRARMSKMSKAAARSNAATSTCVWQRVWKRWWNRRWARGVCIGSRQPSPIDFPRDFRFLPLAGIRAGCFTAKGESALEITGRALAYRLQQAPIYSASASCLWPASGVSILPRSPFSAIPAFWATGMGFRRLAIPKSGQALQRPGASPAPRRLRRLSPLAAPSIRGWQL